MFNQLTIFTHLPETATRKEAERAVSRELGYSAVDIDTQRLADALYTDGKLIRQMSKFDFDKLADKFYIG
nr:MAG TPA: hypothetical protein [Caudoviricetes sp.]